MSSTQRRNTINLKSIIIFLWLFFIILVLSTIIISIFLIILFIKYYKQDIYVLSGFFVNKTALINYTSIMSNNALMNSILINFSKSLAFYVYLAFLFTITFVLYIIYLYLIKELIKYQLFNSNNSLRKWIYEFHVKLWGLNIVDIVFLFEFIIIPISNIMMIFIGILPLIEEIEILPKISPAIFPSIVEIILFGIDIALLIVMTLVETNNRSTGNCKLKVKEFFEEHSLYVYEDHIARVLRIVVIIMILISIPLSTGLVIPALVSKAILDTYTFVAFFMLAITLIFSIAMFILETLADLKIHVLCSKIRVKSLFDLLMFLVIVIVVLIASVVSPFILLLILR